MEMSVYDWIYQIVVEGVKYIILAHWFFGFEFRKKKTRYLLVLYPVFIPVVEYLDIPHIVFFYYYSWGVILLTCLFQERIVEKIKAFFLMWFLIVLGDIIIMMQLLIFTAMEAPTNVVKMHIGCLGGVIWIFLAWKAKKIQLYVQYFWQELSNLGYIVLFCILLVAALILGGIQSYLYKTMTLSIEEMLFISGVFAAGVFVITLVLLLYTKQSKKRLEEINELNIKYSKLQKKYYENSLKQFEDMRSFRHEMNHHIYMLAELSEKNKISALKEYIEEMTKSYEKMRGVQTGNFIADCIISHTLSELQTNEQFQFYLDGRFPKRFFLEDIDFCILLSNVLDNAKDALEKIVGQCVLQVEIKRLGQKFYLIVRNSVLEKEIDFSYTSKLDRKYHGYGVQNIRRIVEKYYGTVVWSIEDGMAKVKIVFDINKL